MRMGACTQTQAVSAEHERDVASSHTQTALSAPISLYNFLATC